MEQVEATFLFTLEQSEKATYRMEENICKPYIWHNVNSQNLQITYAVQYLKKQ